MTRVVGTSVVNMLTFDVGTNYHSLLVGFDKIEDNAVSTSPYLEMLGEHRSLTQVRK